MKRSVLLVSNFLSSSLGGRFYCEDLADHLKSNNWSVITCSNKCNRILRICDMVLTVYLRRKEYLIAQIDVYSGAAFLWAEAVCGILRYIGKPYILTLHGGDLPSFGNHWPKRLERLFGSAIGITTPSPYLFRAMKAFRVNLYLLPNAIELPRYKFRLRESAHPEVIWLRSFHSIYNPCLAVKAMSILRKEFPNIHLTMIGYDRGDGSRQTLEGLVLELQVENQISIRGGVPKAQVPHYLNQGDIFINTSNIDNTPVSVIEAMACGLCVVSTNVGGIPYLLEDGKDALLVPTNDPAATAMAIRRILIEPDLAKTLSANARTKVEEFSWFKILPKWEALFESAMNRSFT